MTAQLDAARLAARAFGRRQARAVIELARESAPDATDEQAVLAFWEEIKDAALAQLPPDDQRIGQTAALKPMTIGEVLAFEAETVPFGKYVHYNVNELPLKYLDYMVGLRDSPDDFLNRARRYLARPDVAERLRQEIGESHD